MERTSRCSYFVPVGCLGWPVLLVIRKIRDYWKKEIVHIQLPYCKPRRITGLT
jgi:hypothetical protein